MIQILKAEKKIRNKESKLSSSPSSIRSYEKAILSSPYSSYLWIKYAAYALDTFGVDKAREILEKALKQLPLSEEREKLNVSIALMNLEYSFGTLETFEKTFEKLLASNNPEKILRHKVRKILQSGSHDEAEITLKTLCKKYSSNIDNWEDLIKYYLIHEKDDTKLQDAINRGVQSLRDSIELKKRVGVLEYTHGSVEKGRTIFENLITEKPKRSDIWAVYINLEIKQKAVDRIRDLFERALSIKFSHKTIQKLALQYYEYELKHHKEKAKEIQSRFNIII